MSQCNYCALQHIRKRGKREGKKVAVETERGFVVVYLNDVPVAWFVELSSHCVC